MLHQELPRIESTPLDGWERWIVPALAVGRGADRCRHPAVVGQALLAALAIVGGAWCRRPAFAPSDPPSASSSRLSPGPDYSLVGCGARTQRGSRGADRRRRCPPCRQRRLSRTFRQHAAASRWRRQTRRQRPWTRSDRWPGATARAALQASRPVREQPGRGRPGRRARRPAAVAFPGAPQRTRWPSRRPDRRADGRRNSPSRASWRQWSTRKARSSRRTACSPIGRWLGPTSSSKRVSPTWSRSAKASRCASLPKARPASRSGPCMFRPTPAEDGAGTFLLFDTQRCGRSAGQFVELAGASRHAADRAGAGRSRRPVPDHEQRLPTGGGSQGVDACPSIRATWS